jgi:hypothetical protein
MPCSIQLWTVEIVKSVLRSVGELYISKFSPKYESNVGRYTDFSQQRKDVTTSDIEFHNSCT